MSMFTVPLGKVEEISGCAGSGFLCLWVQYGNLIKKPMSLFYRVLERDPGIQNQTFLNQVSRFRVFSLGLQTVTDQAIGVRLPRYCRRPAPRLCREHLSPLGCKPILEAMLADVILWRSKEFNSSGFL